MKTPRIKLNEFPPLHISIPLALQHVLSMFGATVVVPLIISQAAGFSPAEQIIFIQAVLLAMGVATLIQSLFGSKLPIVQGSSFVFLPPMLAAIPSAGMVAVQGALIVGGFFEFIAGLSGIVGFLRKFFTPAVTGTTIALIGLSLAGIAVNSSLSSGIGGIIVAIVTASFVMFFALSRGFPKLVPIFLGIAIGYMISIPFGFVDISPVLSVPLFSFPSFFPWGAPVFELPIIIAFIIAFIVSMVESVGDYYAVSSVSGVKVTKERINRGIATEGFGSLFSGLIGGVGTTSYSENIGVVAITGVASRYIVAIGGAILILLSLLPAVSSLLSTIPLSVIGGATLVLYGMIALTGFRIIKEGVEITTRNMFVIGVALIAGVGCGFVPADVLAGLPEYVSILLQSGIATGASIAILLDNVLPGKR
ncbi:purine/pyrimidine permease [Candidatus Micrarchaeota archaeon]|nr:purine/pyrimidine permease [Candidatus Micrarchaeota archaeon]